ncbi:L-tyrosine/L-tryptophan isonitrile synthase family protein [Legionella qingyii]|uniref:L-tyrosine/L-tryptophan isonitrile synthase family protein n=1 Tax=Legionella qingyii TaxID=2184757 RepID=UPI000F8E7D57|nr:L-tyrosine/L-tryptophan isonitrile synthase family protein [Legionella qingyii]RUR29255.1 pyoverdine/dityrosine biosynthesis protein [Legionella qingyii]
MPYLLITNKILNLLSEHRRIPEDEKIDHSVAEFSDKVIKKIDSMVTKGEKIRIVAPAFPEKAPVRGKTLSDSPDMAELLSLEHLNNLCKKIESVYGPGAEVVIYTDGFAFADVFPDIHSKEKRENYLTKLQGMIEKNDLKNIKIINLAGQVDLNQYAETEEHFRQRLKTPQNDEDRNSINLYRGQIQFFTTELKMGYPEKSGSKIKKEAEIIARGVARMSAALSEYLSIIEPDALRISCPPKTVASDKIGLWLHEDHPEGGTPWHNAAVFELSELTNKCIVSFMKAQEAKEKGYLLQMDQEGNPSHFEAKSIYRHACTLQSFFRRAHQKKLALALEEQQDLSPPPSR